MFTTMHYVTKLTVNASQPINSTTHQQLWSNFFTLFTYTTIMIYHCIIYDHIPQHCIIQQHILNHCTVYHYMGKDDNITTRKKHLKLLTKAIKAIIVPTSITLTACTCSGTKWLILTTPEKWDTLKCELKP